MKKIIYSLRILFFGIIMIIHSEYLSAQWSPTNWNFGDGTFKSFGTSGSYLYASAGSNVYKTTDNGNNWINTNNGLTGGISYFAASGSKIYGASGSYVYISTNNGNNWSQSSSTGWTITSLFVYSNDIFISMAYSGAMGGIRKSTDNGQTWTDISTVNRYVTCMILDGENILACAGSSGIYRTQDFGVNWTRIRDFGAEKIAVSDSNIYTYSPGVFHRGTRNGTSWNIINNGLPMQDPGFVFESFYSYQSRMYVSCRYSGIYSIAASDSIWISRNQGLNTAITECKAIIAHNNLMFAGSQIVYKRLLSDIISVRQISSGTSSDYLLEQNYPNPFNPETKIIYQVGKNSLVTIKVYDITGRETDVLVNEIQSPGTYEILFNGDNYSSGIYYYKMTSGNYTEVKKMFLLK